MAAKSFNSSKNPPLQSGKFGMQSRTRSVKSRNGGTVEVTDYVGRIYLDGKVINVTIQGDRNGIKSYLIPEQKEYKGDRSLLTVYAYASVYHNNSNKGGR